MNYLKTFLIALSLCFTQSLNQDEKKIEKYVENKTSEAIDLLEKIVNINSGTLNIKGNQKVGKILQKELDKLGFNTYWVTYPKEVKRAGHLFAEMRGGIGLSLIHI